MATGHRVWKRRVTVAVGAIGLVLGANAVLLVSAATPSGAVAETVTFRAVGFDPFQVPAGVTSLSVTALGAGGEVVGDRGPSGAGGSVSATLPVTACTTLEVLVGGSTIYSNGLPLGGGESGIWDSTETVLFMGAGGGGVGGQDGSVSGIGGAGGAGGGGAPFASPKDPVGGPAQAGGDGTQGTVSGGYPGLGATANYGAPGNGVDGGQNGGAEGTSGAGANGGGRGGGGGGGYWDGGGGGGGGMPTEGGGGGGGGSSFIEAFAQDPVFGVGAGPGDNGSVTISYSGATGSCPPPATTTPTTSATTTAATTPASGSSSGPTGPVLAYTGGPDSSTIAVGLSSLLVGGILLLLGRRRLLRERARHAR
jgi:hypothetical protein